MQWMHDDDACFREHAVYMHVDWVTAEASSSSSVLTPEERMATIRGVNQLADVLKEAIKRKWKDVEGLMPLEKQNAAIGHVM